MLNEYVSIKESAKILDVDRSTINKWINKGRIPEKLLKIGTSKNGRKEWLIKKEYIQNKIVEVDLLANNLVKKS